MRHLRSFVQRFLSRFGYRLEKIAEPVEDAEFLAFHREIAGATMTSLNRQRALYDAVNYLAKEKIAGDIVECGVWKGGSSMLAAKTLLARGDASRRLYLYDTFAGMSEPTDKDVNVRGNPAAPRWKELQNGEVNGWDYASRAEVEKNLASTGYPRENLVFVEGKVEDTIPGTMPEKIALLRLDTDWYESTCHELEYLFPLLSPGGVLILDDYGHWKGAREAVDRYFSEQGLKLFLNRIDYSGRLAIKLPE